MKPVNDLILYLKATAFFGLIDTDDKINAADFYLKHIHYADLIRLIDRAFVDLYMTEFDDWIDLFADQSNCSYIKDCKNTLRNKISVFLKQMMHRAVQEHIDVVFSK